MRALVFLLVLASSAPTLAQDATEEGFHRDDPAYDFAAPLLPEHRLHAELAEARRRRLRHSIVPWRLSFVAELLGLLERR